MSLDQLDKIDFISTTLKDEVLLTISDHHELDNEGQHILLLQNKINSYLQFIESGQILEEYPKAKEGQLFIEAVFKYEPSKDALTFLQKIKEVVTRMGIEFCWKTLKSNN